VIRIYSSAAEEGARRFRITASTMVFPGRPQQLPQERFRLEPLDAPTPDRIFGAPWAITLLDEAMSGLCQQYAAHGKHPHRNLEDLFLTHQQRGPPTCKKAANRLQLSIGAAQTIIHRLGKQYDALLREEIADAVPDPAGIEGEIYALCEALGPFEGRLDR
jgi:hypothetical protein